MNKALITPAVVSTYIWCSVISDALLLILIWASFYFSMYYLSVGLIIIWLVQSYATGKRWLQWAGELK